MSTIAKVMGGHLAADHSGNAKDNALVALRSRTGIALIGTTSLASAVGSFDANVVKVAVPAIGQDLHASVATLQWTLTSYLLAVAALLLLSGALADRFGRRRVLAAGLLIMFVSSVLCAVAPSIGTLIAARVAQGVGGALVVPNSLALLNGTLRKSDRARGIGLWAGLETLATTVGPYVGGWLVDHGSWRAVFLLNLPLILATLLVLTLVPESSDGRQALSLDVFGALLALIGLGGVIYALTVGPASGWTSVPVLITAAVGAVSLAALVPVERHVRAPMLRLSLFVSRQFNAINTATVLLYGALGTASYILFLEFELRLGYSAEQAGAALIPESAIFLVISPLSGALVSRVGPRRPMVAGILLVAVAFIWLSGAYSGGSYTTSILPPVLLWGLGIGLTVSPLTAAVLAAVDDADLGEASAVNDTAARLGAVIVVAMVPVLIGAGDGGGLGHALVHGYQPAMITLGAICVAAALVAVLFVSDDRLAADPQLVPAPRDHGYDLPVPDAATA